MTPDEMPRVLLDALAAHEGFRRLGFESKDIYLVLQDGRVFVMLRKDGKEFTWALGPLPDGMDNNECRTLWEEAVCGWNGEWSDERRWEIWESGPMPGNSIAFLEALKRKGFL